MILHKHRGFVLLELMIAMAVIVIFIGIGLKYQASQNQKQEHRLAQSEYVEEFRQLARAAREYVKDQTGWTIGTTYNVTTATLISTGYLPAGFAVRSIGAGRTPLGSVYYVRARKNAAGLPTIVAFESGATHLLHAQAMGYSSITAPQLTTLRREAANELRTTGMASGIVMSGTRLARGAGTAGWSKDLSDVLGSNLATDSIVILMGYEDLGGFGNELDPAGAAGFSGDCQVVMAPTFQCKNSFGSMVSCDSPNAVSWPRLTVQCPAGYTEQESIPACDPHATFRQTSIGATLSYGTGQSVIPGGQCLTECEYGFSCDALMTTLTRQSIRLNDFEAGNMTCSIARDVNGFRDSSWNLHCGYQTFANTTPAAAGRSLLCCKPL